ncbi:MAG: hypothetical protein M3R15_27140, partial [Acidobacteriota bacterium]|nr:hypothetical protein [Acidobacteriota bacterium]
NNFKRQSWTTIRLAGGIRILREPKARSGEHAIRKDERSLLGIETKWGVSFRAFKITAGRILEPGIATRGR